MNKLKAFRERHSLSQKQAAELLGYGIESWRSYEQGKRKTPLHLLKHMNLYDTSEWKAIYLQNVRDEIKHAITYHVENP